jgi:MHS family alpha-ketoglutarate permease-like MFS transporter
MGAVVAMVLRRSLHETSTAQSRGDAGAGQITELWQQHRPAFLTVLGYTAGGSLMFYTFTTYMQKYLVNSAGMSVGTASKVMTGCLLVFMCLQPVFGAMSDRIGRRNNMLLFGLLGAVVTVPIFAALEMVRNPYGQAALIMAALTVVSLYTSISGIVKAELFPPNVRALGVGLSYALANAVFGGSAEYVALALKSAGHERVFYGYVTLMMVIVLLVSRRIPKKPPYLHSER